jgi:hypothetical protein
MDEKQVEAADDIQNVLASMMAVEPSPEFTARVRQRMAADADAREWRAAHLVLSALAAAAVVVLGVLLILTGSQRIAPEPLMPTVATSDLEPEPRVSGSSEPAAAAAPRQEEAPRALVPRNEIVTIRRLLSAAQAGRFEFELVPEGVPVADELSAPDPISVPPIELMPIGVTSSFE